MKPRISILNRAFRYRDSAHTDVAATFARIKRQQAAVQRIEALAQQAADSAKACELEQRASDTAAVHATFNRRRIKAVK